MGTTGTKEKITMYAGVEKRAPNFFAEVRELYVNDVSGYDAQLTITGENNLKHKLEKLNKELDEIYKYHVEGKTFLNKYDHYLSFLITNDMVSLNYENLCAFYIQRVWKISYFKKKNNIKKNKTYIDLVLLGKATDKSVDDLLNYFNKKKFPLRVFDFQKYPKLKTYLTNEGFNLQRCGDPLVFINDFYIGTMKDFDVLQTQHIINRILRHDHLFYCLNCNLPRSFNDSEGKEGTICPNCFKPYLFFSQSKTKTFDLFANRK
ncbi:MAG: hypothetical protein MJ252_00155 [archaeon]|nr:hypothetical protein [archaeon]